MKKNYSDVYFYINHKENDLPESFSIVTAYNSLGEPMDEQKNRLANNTLLKEMASLPQKFGVVLGNTTQMLESEPGYACAARLHTMYDLSQRWNQFAFYFIDGDELSIVSKDGDIILIQGGFRARILKYGDTDWL